MEGLGAGTHFIGVECPDEPYHLAVNVEIPHEAVLEIVIEGGSWLEGAVSDAAGAPVPAAKIYVLDFRGSAPSVGFAVSGPDGRYRINALKSGPVQLFMVQAEGFGTYPEDFMSVLQGGGSDLHLRPGRNEKDVKLGKGGIVRGVVVEQGTESGVEGVRVSLANMASMFGGQRSATSDAQGRFEITSVAVGGGVLVATKDGWVQPGLTPQRMMGMAMTMLSGKGAADTGQGLAVVISQPGEVVERTVDLARGTFLRGTVVSPAGQPVAGARVSVEFASQHGGMMRQVYAFLPLGEPRLTGPEGAFEIPAPPSGQKVALTARAQGFLDGRSEDLETKAEPLEGIVVKLREGAVLSGRVTGADGEPLEGATVRYTPMEEGQDWGRRWRLQSATPWRTDEKGAFRIPSVEPKKLVVQFAHPSHQSVSKEGIVAVEGKTQEVSAELPAAGGLTGRVLGPDGKPCPTARIDVSAPNPLPPGTDPYYRAPDDVPVDSAGSFALAGLVQGKFRIRALAEGFAPSDFVEAEPGGEPLTLRLGAGFSISGIVRTRQGGPLSNVRVRAIPEASGGGSEESANTNREGRFEIRDVPAGTYEVRAEAGWGVGSSRPNLVPKSVPGVAAGTQDLLVEVEEGLRISGTVTRADGTPVAEGWANAQQILKPGEKGQAATANGPILEGKFDLAGLSPGRYRVNVGGNDLSPKSVEAEAGKDDVAIRYGQGGAVEGRVTKPDGSGVPSVWVGAQGPEGANRAGMTGPDGRFSIKELPAGTYTLNAGMQVEGRNLRGAATGIVVSVGATATGVEIVLQGE